MGNKQNKPTHPPQDEALAHDIVVGKFKYVGPSMYEYKPRKRPYWLQQNLGEPGM